MIQLLLLAKYETVFQILLQLQKFFFSDLFISSIESFFLFFFLHWLRWFFKKCLNRDSFTIVAKHNTFFYEGFYHKTLFNYLKIYCIYVI